MKNNLSLIQPLQYNNLFSSYRNNTNKYRITNYNLPKIPKLFASQEHKEQNETTFFNKNMKLQIKNNNTYNIDDSKKQKLLMYPLLNISIDNKSNIISNREFKPLTLYHSYKKNQEKINQEKINKEKLNNSHRLNMIYLNLFKSPLEKKYNNMINLDSFYNEIDNFEIKDKNKEDEILSQKYNEINNHSIIKIKNIFHETDFGKLNDDVLNLNSNTSNVIIDKFIEKHLNKKKINKIKDENNDINNKNGENQLIITNNVFLDWILDNVRHKLELKNEYNQDLSTVWVRNLIYSEINELKNRFALFRQSMKFSNFVEYMNTQKKLRLLNKKTLKKNEKSNLTSSTLKSNYDNLHNFFNNSNANSKYNYYNNNYYEMNKINKTYFNYNKSINNNTMNFDFFDSNTPKNILKHNKKNIINLNQSYTNHDKLRKKQKQYNTYKKELDNNNKTEINNNNKEKGGIWFKDVFINNPRSHKIKNFENYNSNEIKSKLNIMNNNEKRNNNDILDNIKESKNKEQNDDFSHIKRLKSINYSNNKKKYLILKLGLKKDDNDKKTFTPTKEVILNNSSVKIKPKFKNIILKNIDKSDNEDQNKKSIEENHNNSKENSIYYKREKKSKKYFKFSSGDVGDFDKKKLIKSKHRYKNSIINKFSFKDVDDKKKKTKKRNSVYNYPNIKKKKLNKKKNKNNNLIIKYSSSSSSISSSSLNKEDEKDKFIDIEKEINEKIKKNLVKKRHKTEKPIFNSFQLNKLKKLINLNPNYEDESINKQELNEDIDIRKEIDLLNNELSNTEAYNLFNLIIQLKNYLKKKYKTEEIRDEIKTKRIEIKNIIENYFKMLLSNSSIKTIKEEQPHLEIFEKLPILKRYCSFSSKELNNLVMKILHKRKKEVRKYEMGYKFTKEKIGQKSRSSSIEPSFNKKSGKTINSYKDDNLKNNNKNKKGKSKKDDLIYNNSYLFNENENYDDNKSNLLIKKEIQDILNTDYGNIPINIVNTSIFISSRKKI